MNFGPQQAFIRAHNTPRAHAKRLVGADTDIGVPDVTWKPKFIV
jgi:hypothetical protein